MLFRSCSTDFLFVGESAGRETGVGRVRLDDRAVAETRPSDYGIRSLSDAIVQSELFLTE